MSGSKKLTPHEELERIEDALVDSILSASGEELRAELAGAGLNPEACIAEVEAALAAAKAECAHNRLDRARTQLAAWQRREGKLNVGALDAARAKFENLRSADPELKQRMMLAARKAEGLSDNDLEALIEGMAALEEFEGKPEDE